MPRMCMLSLRDGHGAGGQWAVHPAQACLCNFHPAFTDRRQAALFEGLANTVGIQPYKMAVTGIGHE